jgi:regulator of sirC expression with transglutaminase-like and TPR domain
MSAEATDYLKRLGESGDGPHDIAEAALMLASLDHPGEALEPSRAHLRHIRDAMQAEVPRIRRVGDGAAAVANLLSVQLGYDGDRTTYDDPQNADLMAVIVRRRGLPVALGILYIHAARAAGLGACGLNTQGHFVVRFRHRHDDVTVDPFNGGAVMVAGQADPRASDAALAQPVGDSDVLLRLTNNLKIRALDQGNHERGLELARRMVLLGPRRPELWFDLGRINEAVGILGAARQAYETCLEFALRGQTMHNEAVLSLTHLKRRLN